MAVKEHPTLKVVSEDPTDLINTIDKLAIRNLQANPEDVSKWLQSKYPDLDVTVDSGEIYTKPKGQIAWEPVSVSPISESDVLEMAASIPSTLAGPIGQASVAAVFDQARQQIAKNIGMQEGISPGRTAAVSALAAAAPFVGAAGVKGATKLGAKLSKNIPESVWKKFAENYDELKGLVKASSDEALPQLQKIAQRTGEGLSSAWDLLGEKYGELMKKAATETGEVPTEAIINEIENRRLKGLIKPGASSKSPLTFQGSKDVREFIKALGVKKDVPVSEAQGLIELGKKTVQIPQTRKVSEKQAESFWAKVKPEIGAQLKQDLNLAGIDTTTNIPKLTNGAVIPEIEVPVATVLNPRASGEQLLQTLETFKNSPSFTDKNYNQAAKAIISTGKNLAKDLLVGGASKETQRELGKSSSKFANMELLKDVLFGKQRSQTVDDITDLVGTKVDTAQASQALKNIFTSSQDMALLRQQQLLDAASDAMRPQLEKDLTGIAMRNVGTGSLSGGGIAGSLGAATGFGIGGPIGAALGGAGGTVAGGFIGGPKFTRDYLLPAALIAEKAVGKKAPVWSRVPIVEATKSVQKGNASKTKGE